MSKTPKKKCYNCKHAGVAFKIGKLTHLHCNHPCWGVKHKNGEFVSPYDTLMTFRDSCEKWEGKDHKS